MRNGMTAAALWLTLLALGGCVSDARWKTRKIPEPSQAGQVSEYLELLGNAASGDPTLQADAYYDAERAYVSEPNVANTLAYGLILATPAHPSSNPAEARSLLVQILAEPALLTPDERNLARIGLNAVQAQLLLETGRAQTVQAQEQLSGVLAQERRNYSRQIASQQAEITALQKALAEAEAKLDAVATIERSLEEADRGN